MLKSTQTSAINQCAYDLFREIMKMDGNQFLAAFGRNQDIMSKVLPEFQARDEDFIGKWNDWSESNRFSYLVMQDQMRWKYQLSKVFREDYMSRGSGALVNPNPLREPEHDAAQTTATGLSSSKTARAASGASYEPAPPSEKPSADLRLLKMIADMSAEQYQKSIFNRLDLEMNHFEVCFPDERFKDAWDRLGSGGRYGFLVERDKEFGYGLSRDLRQIAASLEGPSVDTAHVDAARSPFAHHERVISGPQDPVDRSEAVDPESFYYGDPAAAARAESPTPQEAAGAHGYESKKQRWTGKLFTQLVPYAHMLAECHLFSQSQIQEYSNKSGIEVFRFLTDQETSGKCPAGFPTIFFSEFSAFLLLNRQGQPSLEAPNLGFLASWNSSTVDERAAYLQTTNNKVESEKQDESRFGLRK